jgi:hypothetical protein
MAELFLAFGRGIVDCRFSSHNEANRGAGIKPVINNFTGAAGWWETVSYPAESSHYAN